MLFLGLKLLFKELSGLRTNLPTKCKYGRTEQLPQHVQCSCMKNSMECAIKKAKNRPGITGGRGDKSLQGNCTFLLQAGREGQ
jgi:hypothetical protein